MPSHESAKSLSVQSKSVQSASPQSEPDRPQSTDSAAAPCPTVPTVRTAPTETLHAARLQRGLGLAEIKRPVVDAPHPDADWARSGMAMLSGEAPAPITACMRGAWALATGLAPRLAQSDIDAAALLGERAAWLGLAGRRRTTAGGAGRLMKTRDGWIAAQLPRADDLAAVPAWLECEARPSSIDRALDMIETAVSTRDSAPLVERARLLALAVAALPTDALPMADPPLPAWVEVRRPRGAVPPASTPAGHRRQPLRVLDLSTLWAGPLCGRLLAASGADVVKVESQSRTDGARHGSNAFFDAMNGGKSSLCIDPTHDGGRDLLLAAIAEADVVIESARPRALRHLGIEAERLIDAYPGLTWVSITGYGRTPPHDEYIAFGDDAAVAAGLVGRDAAGEPILCGDAIADPLTGLHAAVAALAGAHQGGGLFDVSLVGVAGMVRGTRRSEPPMRIDDHDVQPLRATVPVVKAPELGADTEAVIRRWGIDPGAAAPC